jgi:hypothetical protein
MESGRAGGVEREIYIYFGSSGRGRVGGVKIRTGGRVEIFLGWRRMSSKIFLIVAAGISN